MSIRELRELRVTPSAPAPNYAPGYLAEDLGFFAQEGLKVDSTIVSGPGSSWLSDNLIDGLADIALGGVWIPLAYRDRIADLDPFALVCSRNPQVLIGRAPVENFTWDHAYGLTVLLPLSSTSQWLYLEGCLRDAGYDPTRITFVRDLEEQAMSRLWRAGLGDFILVFPPLSEDLESEGFHAVTTLAEDFGAVPWSVYYATPEFIRNNGEAVSAFARGIQRSFDWLHSHTPQDIAYALHRRFPAMPHDRLTRSISRILANDVWPATVEIEESSYMRYQKMICDYGLTPEVKDFDEVVTPRIARELAIGQG
jgi:NitT/TauT family transport system substrate-binding protein